MTEKALNYTLIVLLLVSLTITNWSCEKIFGDDSVEETITLSQDKTQVTPFEIVTITAADYTFSNDVYYATIADKDIELKKTTDNQLMYMMPYITSGNHKLVLTIDDVEYNIGFDINSPAPISNPEEVIDSYKQNVVVAFDTLKYMNQVYNLQIESQNLQVIENYLTDFDQAYASATEDEKQELAQFMQANPYLFDFSNFDYSFFNDSLNTSKDFVKWDQKLTRDMQYYTGLVIATGATVVLFNGALVSLNPLAIFITGGALLTEVYLLKSQTSTILNRSYKPFEFEISNELRSQTVEFDNDVEYILGIDGTYRTLYNNDQGSSNIIIELVANINTFTGYWNNVLENIPGVSGSVTNLDTQNSYVINTNESSVTPQYISIENISNSNVTLSQFFNTDAVRVTFTTTSDEDEDFTFDIVYTNPDFSAERINVSAKLVPEEIKPYSIYIWSGNNQVGEHGQTLQEPIEIKVIDKDGNPFPGATIHFNANDGSTSSSQITSNNNGFASVNWTLGNLNSTQTVIVNAFEDDGITNLQGSPAEFTATTCTPPTISLIEQEPCNFNSGYFVVIRFSYYDPNGLSIQGGWRPVSGSAYCYYMPTLISGIPSDGIYEYKTYSQICCCGPEKYEEEENFFVYNECGVQSNIVYFYMIP